MADEHSPEDQKADAQHVVPFARPTGAAKGSDRTARAGTRSTLGSSQSGQTPQHQPHPAGTDSTGQPLTGANDSSALFEADHEQFAWNRSKPQITRPNRVYVNGVKVSRAAAKKAFLAEFSKSGNVTMACEVLDLNPRTPYDWREKDPLFAQHWTVAERIGSDAIEQELFRRAVIGWDEPQFYRGQEVGSIRRHSDLLLMKLMEAKKPEFRTKRTEVTGANGGPVTLAKVPIELLTMDELKVLRSVAAKAELPAGARKALNQAIDAEFVAERKGQIEGIAPENGDRSPSGDSVPR